uniref:LpxL/LpxP family acyltransferase n=1 Tax=Vaginimicrobium propionicum TaxID=1871034 RepID=UPI000970713B|nr:hypothetical protein [Vaginimicrobium propionicum]
MSEVAKLRALKLAAYVPELLWNPLGHALSWWLAWRVPKPVRQWQLNAEVVTGKPVTKKQTRQAMWYWFRNTVGSLQLGRWSMSKINRIVSVNDLERLHSLLAERGLVLALAHMGSWDLAGAFACLNGLPVTSVAENLPSGQFEYFSTIRAKLGLRIFNQKEAHLVSKLTNEVQQGRVVCLVADRDFSARGVPVIWKTPSKSIKLTMPPGPALIAIRTGAALVPVTCTFDAGKMRIHVGSTIEPVSDADPLATMTQELADAFAEQITAYPTDWHMLQKFFPGVTP